MQKIGHKDQLQRRYSNASKKEERNGAVAAKIGRFRSSGGGDAEEKIPVVNQNQ